MPEKPGGGIICLGVDQLKLRDYVIKTSLQPAEQLAVTGIDGPLHEQPVQPHLVGVALLVPETSLGSPWLALEHLHELVKALSISLIACDGVEFQHYVSDTDIVHAMLFHREVLDRAILSDITLQHTPDIVEHSLVSEYFRGFVHCLKHDCRLIALLCVLRIVFPHSRQSHALCHGFSCVNHKFVISVLKKGPQHATAAPLDRQIVYLRI